MGLEKGIDFVSVHLIKNLAVSVLVLFDVLWEQVRVNE